MRPPAPRALKLAANPCARRAQLPMPAPAPKPAVPKPAPALAATKPAEPAPVAPVEKKTAAVAFSKDDFKNDPLIQKALEIFKGTIVEVRA